MLAACCRCCCCRRSCLAVGRRAPNRLGHKAVAVLQLHLQRLGWYSFQPHSWALWKHSGGKPGRRRHPRLYWHCRPPLQSQPLAPQPTPCLGSAQTHRRRSQGLLDPRLVASDPHQATRPPKEVHVATARWMPAGGEDASDGEAASTGAARRRASRVHASPVGAGHAQIAPTSRAGILHRRMGVVGAWVGPGRVVRGAGVHGEVVDRGPRRGRAVRVDAFHRGDSRAQLVRAGELQWWVVRRWEV